MNLQPYSEKVLVKVDATADLYIHVLAEDIACGVPGDCRKCAVAQAIKRCTGNPDANVEIYRSRAYIEMPIDARTIRVNSDLEGVADLKPGDMAMHRFRCDDLLYSGILSFDYTHVADPAGYRFKAPTATNRLGTDRTTVKDPSKIGTRKQPTTNPSRKPWIRARGPIASTPAKRAQ